MTEFPPLLFQFIKILGIAVSLYNIELTCRSLSFYYDSGASGPFIYRVQTIGLAMGSMMLSIMLIYLLKNG